MAVLVRASVSNNADQSIVIPATAVVGDLMVIQMSSNTGYFLPSGFTDFISPLTATGGTYNTITRCAYKYVTAGQPGSTLTYSGGNAQYGIVNMLVLSGAPASNPINASGISLHNASPATAPSITTTGNSSRFFFFNAFSNGSSLANFSTPSGTTLQTRKQGTLNYIEGAAFSNDLATEGAGAKGAVVSNYSGGSGSGHAISFAITDANSLPNAPTGLTTNSPVTVNNTLTATWTHSDPESDPQAKYQIRYRQV